MDERKQAELSPPPVGGASLLVVFAVLCLTVFALLSLSTVRANGRLSEASAQAVADYYAADCAAQEILARLRAGEEPEGVEFEGFGELYASYACPISDQQELRVEVRFPEVPGIPDGFDEMRSIIEDILPCHLEIVYVYWFVTWQLMEERFDTWGDIEALHLSWEALEKLVV